MDVLLLECLCQHGIVDRCYSVSWTAVTAVTGQLLPLLLCLDQVT